VITDQNDRMGYTTPSNEKQFRSLSCISLVCSIHEPRIKLAVYILLFRHLLLKT